jgi:ribosomal protein S18 acetylase RimI-like enzyme
MHAIVRVLRQAVDGVDMGAVFDLVALTIGEADLHISDLDRHQAASETVIEPASDEEREVETMRRPTAEDVDTIAAWHPIARDEVLGWWQPAYVRPWVMVDEAGALVAYGELWVDDEEDEVELARLIVAPELRGRGLGKRLTIVLTAMARETGLKTTMLRVEPDNEVAIRCYRACGFEPLDPEEAAVWNEGQRREWYWMRLPD